MPDPAYWPGQQINLRGVFKNSTTSTGVEVDPTAVTLYYRNPSGAVSTVTTTALTKTTTGTYDYLLTTTTSGVGEWQWGFKGAGTNIGSNLGGRFSVLETQLTT